MSDWRETLKGIWRGERVFIMGTGPSLDKITPEEWEELRRGKNFIFGVNTFLMHQEAEKLGTTFYCVSESQWLTEVGIPDMVDKFRIDMPPISFYAHHWPLGDLDSKAWNYVLFNTERSMQLGEFSGFGETFDDVADGKSVVMFAVQLACWLGFKEVYLLGCDATTKGHAEGLTLGKGDGIRNRQDSFLRSAMVAEEVMAKHGRELVNCTDGGKLNITRKRLVDVL